MQFISILRGDQTINTLSILDFLNPFQNFQILRQWLGLENDATQQGNTTTTTTTTATFGQIIGYEEKLTLIVNYEHS